MTVDFVGLPPEVNSGRMYSGAGSGPMVAAASAWKGLAAELQSTALSYGSLITKLTSEEWHGPASAAMAAAATPYVAWMSSTAVRAEQTAAQAEAAVAAYEAAFAATVPPPLIVANRAQLVALIATNILGQNSSAIAAAEAQYAEMWAQDATAMYGYAASSAAATELTAFTTPAGNHQGTLVQLMTALPNALKGLASPLSTSPASAFEGVLTDLSGLNPFAAGSATQTTGLNGLLNLFSGNNTAFGALANSTLGNTIFSSGFYMPSNTMAPFLSLLGFRAAESAVGHAAGQAATGALGAVLAGPASGIAGLGNAVSASLGHAPIIGALSVPPSWTAPAPLTGPLASALGGTPMVPPPAIAAGMPPIPLGNTTGQAYGRAVPQYGFRPSFVARPPAAG